MAQDQQVTIPGPDQENGGDSSRGRRSKPTKSLPTDRINFKKQLDLLRAYGAASEPNGKPVTNNDVAAIVSMQASTVSLANAFFSDSKLLTKVPDGGYMPASEVLGFHRAYAWNPETASHKLAPVIGETWFAKALTPKLAFRALEEDEAVATLAEEASAGPEYKNQLRMLLDYMDAAGLVQRDGTLIKLVRQTPTAAAGAERPSPSMQQVEGQETTTRPAISTGFVQPAEGTVQFHVSVKVDMQEFATWHADRIAAFFGGIAQVLAAKAAIEKGGSSGKD